MKVTDKIRKPIEGEWFEVNLNSMKKNLFKRKKQDSQQEFIRQIILEAFNEVKKNPKKYPAEFQTLIPKKTWKKKSIIEFKNMAIELGDHIADWVEQALVWAQRISNQESWKKVCNDPDTLEWYRLVRWKENYWRFIGGSKALNDENSPTSIYHYNYHGRSHIQNAVPLIVGYKSK